MSISHKMMQTQTRFIHKHKLVWDLRINHVLDHIIQKLLVSMHRFYLQIFSFQLDVVDICPFLNLERTEIEVKFLK